MTGETIVEKALTQARDRARTEPGAAIKMAVEYIRAVAQHYDHETMLLLNSIADDLMDGAPVVYAALRKARERSRAC